MQRAAESTYIMGRPDTGKSFRARELLAARPQARYLDLDPGQGELLAPGVIGLADSAFGASAAQARRPAGPSGAAESGTRQPDRTRAWFVGSASPAGFQTRFFAGLQWLQDLLEQEGNTAIIDSCGLADGSLGRRFQLRSIELLRPTRVILLGDLDWQPELEEVLGDRGVEFETSAVSEDARPRSTAERRRTRERRFRDYFAGAKERALELPAHPLIRAADSPAADSPRAASGPRRAVASDLRAAADSPAADSLRAVSGSDPRAAEIAGEIAEGAILGLCAADGELLSLAWVQDSPEAAGETMKVRSKAFDSGRLDAVVVGKLSLDPIRRGRRRDET
jgi:polynucleotide 5'-kinase involved in rRNA processing